MTDHNVGLILISVVKSAIVCALSFHLAPGFITAVIAWVIADFVLGLPAARLVATERGHRVLSGIGSGARHLFRSVTDRFAH